MTLSQKHEQEFYFKMVLKFGNENGSYLWPNENASYTIIDGKFSPNDNHSRKVMMETTTKEFHKEFILN